MLDWTGTTGYSH